jgi:hypothetical protein
MDFANRGDNRPIQQPAPQRDVGNARLPHNNKSGFDLGKLGSVFVLVSGALVAALLITFLVFGNSTTKMSKETDLINTERYQAVFLNSQDGQVYFGKLAVYNSDLYVLSDIYYVRVETPIQPEGVDQAPQPNISLAKLGNELHGPEDVMFIARDKVLYWENLKNEGQVVTAITEFKASGGASNQQNTTQPTETTETPTQQ